MTLLGIGAIIGAGIFATIGTGAAGDAVRPGASPSLMLSFTITSVIWYLSNFDDPAGHVYVVDHGNSRIQVFTNDGRFLVSWGEAGSAPGQFLDPRRIALDREGNLYVADLGNQRIQEFGAFVAVKSTSWTDARALYR